MKILRITKNKETFDYDLYEINDKDMYFVYKDFKCENIFKDVDKYYIYILYFYLMECNITRNDKIQQDGGAQIVDKNPEGEAAPNPEGEAAPNPEGEAPPILKVKLPLLLKVKQNPVLKVKKHPLTKVKQHLILKVKKHLIPKVKKHPMRGPKVKQHPS